MQRLVDALLPGPAIEGFEARLQRVEIVARLMALEALAQALGLGHAFADRIEHGQRAGEFRFLRNIEAAQALLHLQHAVVRALEAGEDLQQRRLAAAVAADQPDALAAIDRQRRAVEQRHMAIGEVGVGEGQQGHACIVGDPLKPPRRTAGSSAPRR